MEAVENQEVNQEVVETPATPETPIVETPVEEEIVYSYQPVDSSGRALGGKQVVKAKNWEELAKKIANSHSESIKLNRELNRKNRLGIVEEDEIPAEVPQASSDDFVDFSPKELSADEKMQIAHDLLDPDKFDSASNLLITSTLGASPEKVRNVLTKTQEDVAMLRAKAEADLFVQTTPDYYICKENFETMTSWMVKNKLTPTAKNFKYAYDTLKAVGLLLEAPIVREEPVAVVPEVTPETESLANTPPVPEPVSRITNAEPQSQEKRPARIASGLNRNNTSNSGVSPAQSGTLTVDEIERMPSEEYKRRLLREPGFAKRVDDAYADLRKNRMAQ